MANTIEHRSARSEKVMVLITEDWFALSHFKPLIRALVAADLEVVVVTHVANGFSSIEELGARVIPFDFARASRGPVQQLRMIQNLRRLVREEQPSVVHAIALKPIVLGGAAFLIRRRDASRPKLVMHLTGVGFAGTTKGTAQVIHAGALRLIATLLRRPDTALFVENPDDAAQVVGVGKQLPTNVTILGGAGVDLERYRTSPTMAVFPPVAGFAGRMVWSKGVDVLVEAQRLLAGRGLTLDVYLAGARDPANPRAVALVDLDRWRRDLGVTWLGHVEDIVGFWQDVTIAVVPSRGGEGLPRAMLEAAACARPLIVSDVPGCRYFVRDGIEGLVVPPDHPAALADAIERLIRNPELAAAMGRNARARVADGFTEALVAEAVINAYRKLLSR